MRAAPGEASYSPPGEPTYSPASEAAERRQARQMFEAKELDVNPRKPFYITVGALGLFALGTVGYFWYQLQPRSAFTTPARSTKAAPSPAAAPLPDAAAPLPIAARAMPASAADAPAAATVTPPTLDQPASAPTPRTAPVASPASAPTAAPLAARGPVFARQSAPANGAVAATQPGPARRASKVQITPARVQSDPLVESAYQAYNAGDLPRALADYRQVLRANPVSRDALLGLAAVETQTQHYEAAEGYYTRLLELDPRDAHAQAGLIGLRGQGDPLAAESRLKIMIAAQPEAGFLNFTLGNQYAAQGRWAEAQQAYFQAYASDPEHPDFAYNLAISLDQLHQAKPALEYYRRALALGQARPTSFDQARVSKRVSQLER